MKMAYLCADPGVPVFGSKGCSLHVQEVIRAYRRLGLDVDLFARRLGGKPPADLDGLAITPLSKIPKTDGPMRERAALASNVSIAQQIRDAAPFDIAYERYALWSYAGLAAARSSGAVTVLEVNAPLIDEQSQYRSLHDSEGALEASLKAFAAADVIVAVSNEVADYLRQFEQARDKVHVIPNGVDVERFESARGKRARHPHAFTIGFVGTLKPWHGVDILINAFNQTRARIPEAQLLIVGDGPERSRLEEQCAGLGIADNVTFAGSVDPGQVPDLLSRMDVGVAPYPKLPGFYFSPLKAFEYLASGMPVVASDIGQLRDILRGGETGLLCAPGDPSALANALYTLYEQPQRRDAMGLTGQRLVHAECTWQSVAMRILNLTSLPDRNKDPRSIAG